MTGPAAGGREVRVPALGDFKDVPVIEVLVAVGQSIAENDALVTLESDKATMDVPAPFAGVVREVRVKVGDRVAEGSVLALVEAESGAAMAEPAVTAAAPAPAAAAAAASAPAASASGRTGDTARLARPVISAAAADEPAADVTLPLVVLGAGPGGYTAAFRAADLGLKVGLIERAPTLGGVCLNVGCIPSKALLHAAQVIDEAAAMAAAGVSFGAPQIDLDRLRAWKHRVVSRLTSGLNALAKQRKVEVLRGEARFLSPHRLELRGEGGRRVIAFEQCIVAAGSEVVRMPGAPDDPRIIDSTGALELTDRPARLLVIGGGIIGLEMACVYAALGSKITVVELAPGLIPGCDRDLVRPLEKRLRGHYEGIHTGVKVTAMAAAPEGIRVTFEGSGAPAAQSYDRVLVAIGRRPNGRAIGAEAAGVAVDERGFIPVDRQQRTNVAHIFAIGDVVGQPMLAHKATHEGKVAAEVAAGLKRAFDARVIPSVAYTDPEIAWVGLTETEAQAKGIKVGKGAFPWIASGRSLALGREEGFTKLLFDPDSHRVLGAGIVGTNAGELIAEVALAIEMGADAHDIGLTIHAHPTLSETVAFSAEAFEGTLTDLYLPKKS
ncbi:MAG: dihydrolipoyl dehydrogenase [Proteobacteria bacterium]|nr:dihydrolipoyl dehydrogenase [Pseudomonadota bacterium]